MPSKADCFYVYYRIVADTVAARSRIRALMAEIEARTGVVGTLLARCDDASTWMEAYTSVTRAAAFRRVLEATATKHDAAALTPDGKRHVEHFAALQPLGRRRKS